MPQLLIYWVFFGRDCPFPLGYRAAGLYLTQQPENLKCKLPSMVAVSSLQKNPPVQISPCLCSGRRFPPALCLPCQVPGAHKGSGKAQTLQDLKLQICSWNDWTLSLITSHLSVYFQIIFFLKNKEKYYTVADDGEMEEPGKDL